MFVDDLQLRLRGMEDTKRYSDNENRRDFLKLTAAGAGRHRCGRSLRPVRRRLLQAGRRELFETHGAGEMSVRFEEVS
jgi:hypothetical protein